MNNKPKTRPRDPWLLAKMIGDIATGQVEDKEPERTKCPAVSNPPKNAAAQALSALGASKGGKARAAKLSPRKRKQIARNAAKTRWTKN